MEINNHSNGSTISSNFTEPKNKLYLSKSLLEKAKNINKTTATKTAVIYNNKVIAINNAILRELKNDYKGDFQQYDGVLIANNKAQSYLEKISDYVLNDLNVKNADKNRDGMISMAESLDTKNIIDEQSGSILKPRDVLDPKLIKQIEKDNSNFMSINDIINLHIELDKNKDGKVSIKEAKANIPKNSNQIQSASSELDKLYKRLEKLQKEIGEITVKLMHTNDEKRKKELQIQLGIKNSELMAVLDQIKKKVG